jgi:hypothetical protein
MKFTIFNIAVVAKRHTVVRESVNLITGREKGKYTKSIINRQRIMLLLFFGDTNREGKRTSVPGGVDANMVEIEVD